MADTPDGASLSVTIEGTYPGITCITLRIKGVHIPSTSNNRTIGYKWSNTKKGRQKHPFIMKKKGHQAALNLLSTLYAQEVYEKRYLPIPVIHVPTTIVCLIAKRPGRWDSHNQSKPIGDWLQEIGMIDDDATAEILCFKAEDYGFKDTTIVLRPRAYMSLTDELIHRFIPDEVTE